MVDLRLVGGEGICYRPNGCDVSNVVHQKIDQFMQQRLIPQPVFLHNITDDQSI